MKVTVFASSSSRTSSSFLEVAFSLGALLAERGHVCVNGGGNEGCMGALNKGTEKLGESLLICEDYSPILHKFKLLMTVYSYCRRSFQGGEDYWRDP